MSAEYILSLYDEGINGIAHYDLTTKSDHYTPAQMVEVILNAMRNAGLIVEAT